MLKPKPLQLTIFFKIQIRKKVLVLLEQWGKKFEKDHDILPLFSDVYKALKKKGIEFPDSSE